MDIRLLGEQRVTAGGTPVEALRSPRTLGLLAYLVVHAGAPQLRQHIAGVFWPESTEAQARTNLRKELHQLRQALTDPDSCLAVDTQAVCWREDAPCAVDVIAFEQAADDAEAAAEADDEAAFLAAAERAVGAYGGDLLPGFYDNWVLAERERLRRRCVGLLDRLAATLAEAGEFTAAVAHARRRVELEPLEEPGYRTVMALQARAGDRAGALRTFHRCASVLDRELGVEPDPETHAVYEDLVARTAEPADEVPALRQAVPLVGRDTQLATLERAWAHVGRGPRIALVAGEAGVGKTRLATELAGRVARGGDAVVAHARCFASRGRLALSPVAEWLRSPAIGRSFQHLDPVWRAEVGRLVPELAPGGAPQGPPLSDAWQRRQFLEGLAHAVLAAGTPTLLVLDDLQWCDAETLGWLELLVHLDPAAPLLVVATLRREELDDNPELVRYCRRLRAAGLLDEVDLVPLDVEEVAALAASLKGRPLDEAAARRLLADTGGFPLFVVEAVREGTPRPARVEAVLAGRLAQLGEAARSLAGLAAAVGRDFALELLARAGDLDADALVEAVDELWRRRLLREHSATTYDFAHDLLRDAAYAQLSPPHRRLLHQRIAAALEALHANDPEPVAAQVADQHERGGQPDRAIDFHALAAEAATAVFAHDDAVDHYERALELLAELPTSTARDRREAALHEAMVPPLFALGSFADPRLGASHRRTAELGERLGDEAIVLNSQAALCGHLFVQGRSRDAAALLERLMTPDAGLSEEPAQLLMLHAGTLTSLGHPHAGLERFDQVMARPDRDAAVGFHGFPVRVMGLGWRAHALWLLGRADDAAASADASLDLAEELDHPFSRAIAQGYAAITFRLLGDVERAAELATAVRRLCDRYDFAYYGDWGRILEGWATGGAAGEARIREGLDRLVSAHAGARKPFWLALLAEVLAGSRRSEEASRVLGEARTWAEEHGDRWWLAELWRADAALHRGAETERMLEQALAVARKQGAVALELRAATDLTRHRLDAGDTEKAAALLEPVRARSGGCNPTDLAAADALLTTATV